MKAFRYRKITYTLLFSLVFNSALGDNSKNNLPDIGDSAGVFLSPAEEQKFGQAFMRSVRQHARLIDDLDTRHYLESLGQRLAAGSKAPKRQYSFFMVDDASINAFAGPGGYIGVHTGLFMAAKNESELAGVLAHEIAHVTQRHLVRAYEASNRLGLPTAAAMIAAILLGAATDSDAGIAAAAAVQASSLQYQINFTRANEKEADRIGIQTLSRVQIDPFGMPDFFERLQRATRLYGERPPEFLSTHPVTANRIAETITRAEQVGHKGSRDSLDFQLIKARLDIFKSHNLTQKVSQYKALVKADKDSAAAHYGLALALDKVSQHTQAIQILQTLHRKNPDHILFRTTLAQLQLNSKQSKPALQLLSDTLKLYPRDITVSAHYARALLQNKQAKQARNVLLDVLQKPAAQQPGMYTLLARAASASGNDWQARQATAESYHLNGQTKAAAGQLEQALQSKTIDYHDRAALEARLKEFKVIVQEEQDSL